MYSSIDSTKSPASGAGNVREPRLISFVGSLRVYHCVCAFRAVEVPVVVCLRSYNHVTSRKTVRCVRIALEVVIQNDGDFVDVILLYAAQGLDVILQCILQ